MLIWGAAALGAFTLIYYFDDLRAALVESASRNAAIGSKPNETKAGGGFDRTARLMAVARGHFVFDASINDRPVVVEFRVDWQEKVFPMVPAGASNDDVVLPAEQMSRKDALR